MFGGLLSSAMNAIDKGVDAVSNKLERVLDDPIGEVTKDVVNTVTSPVRNTVDVIDGLTEGELRLKAIAHLGTDVVVGMGTSELIEWYQTLES